MPDQPSAPVAEPQPSALAGPGLSVLGQPASERGLSVALFNDTGNQPHVGCLAVTDAHTRMLERIGVRLSHRFFVHQYRQFWKGTPEASVAAVLHSELAELLHQVDAVVVNAEGTIHHGAGQHLLAILAAAQRLSRPTFLVNAVFQDCPGHDATLRALDDFTVRDACSSAYLRSRRIAHRLVLDSILEAGFSPDPRHDFEGRVVVTDVVGCCSQVAAALEAFRAELGDRARFYPLEHPDRFDDWRHAVADFRTASVVVTARHHGIYLAGLAGVPFVPLPSNSWKVEGLLALFGDRIPVCTQPRELARRCAQAQQDRSLFAEFAAFLQSQRPLSTFRVLAGLARERSGSQAQATAQCRCGQSLCLRIRPATHSSPTETLSRPDRPGWVPASTGPVSAWVLHPADAASELAQPKAGPAPAQRCRCGLTSPNRPVLAPAGQRPTSRTSRSRPICLATNYLLMSPATWQMWAQLAQALDRQGCQLVLLSTTLPEQPLPCPVYRHPYLMRDFAAAFPSLAAHGGFNASAWELERLQADISRVPVGYRLDQALAGLNAFRAYACALLSDLQPGFVLAADDTLCQTALLQRLCAEAHVPVAIYERGLLPETLMLESRGIQAWSDLRMHWLARQMPAADPARYAAIRDYYLSRKPQKYDQPDFGGGGEALRRQLGLQAQQVVVFLGGGYEANGQAAQSPNYARLFFTGFPTTQSALMALWQVVEKRPHTALVFKPHPLDPEPYTVAEIEGVRVVRDVNVHALIDAADVVAAQFTTLQFEAALYDKPVLLLARSAWWGRGAAYEVDGPEALSAQLEAALERRDWARHQANAQAFLSWIMDHFLIGCTEAVPTRAHLDDLAAFIARNALDARGLPPAMERWAATLGWLEMHRAPAKP